MKNDGDLTTRTVNAAMGAAFAALARAHNAAESNLGAEAVWAGITEVNLWIGVVGFTLDDLVDLPLWLAFKYVRNAQTHQSGWLLTDFEEATPGSLINISLLRWPEAAELEHHVAKRNLTARQAYETVLAGQPIASSIHQMLVILVARIDRREKRYYDALLDLAHEDERGDDE